MGQTVVHNSRNLLGERCCIHSSHQRWGGGTSVSTVDLEEKAFVGPLCRWENSMCTVIWRTFLSRPLTPFGASGEYHPISTKNQARLHQFGKKVFSGMFLCAVLLCAGGSWKGVLLAADVEALHENDASQVYGERISTNKVLVPKERRLSHFPMCKWSGEYGTELGKIPKEKNSSVIFKEKRTNQILHTQ